jgi:hypothetical protein
MRTIRAVLLLLVLVIVGVLAYNDGSGYGWTLHPPNSSGGIDAETAREKGAELATKAAATAKSAVERSGEVVGDAALTAKIKSKLALDDFVKARTIGVDTNGSVVILTGNGSFGGGARTGRAPSERDRRRYEGRRSTRDRQMMVI